MASKTAVKAANALPEMTVSTAEFTDIARTGLSARSDKAEAEAREDLAKKNLVIHAGTLREAETLKDHYVGIVRVVKAETDTEDLSPVGIQFKLSATKSSLKPEDMQVLDELFGAVRPQMWEKATIVTEITDPMAVITQLQKAGIDPKTVLNFSVKEGMDAMVSQYNGLTAVNAVVPKAGILARADETGKTWTPEAKEYFRAYLKAGLTPAVTLGGKGKA